MEDWARYSGRLSHAAKDDEGVTRMEFDEDDWQVDTAILDDRQRSSIFDKRVWRNESVKSRGVAPPEAGWSGLPISDPGCLDQSILYVRASSTSASSKIEIQSHSTSNSRVSKGI